MAVLLSSTPAPPCSRTRCRNPTEALCDYRDRLGFGCVTAWCSDHAHHVMGAAYCPRHAGILRAIWGSANPDQLPPVNSRAVSLTSWVANAIDEEIHGLLKDMADPHAHEIVVVDPLTCVELPGVKGFSWQRTWRLTAHGETSLAVSVDVGEGTDRSVHIRVGQVVVTHIVPPWVEQHQLHLDLSEHEETRQRDQFYERILFMIGQAVEISQVAAKAAAATRFEPLRVVPAGIRY